jgi:hypothetical protein
MNKLTSICHKAHLGISTPWEGGSWGGLGDVQPEEYCDQLIRGWRTWIREKDLKHLMKHTFPKNLPGNSYIQLKANMWWCCTCMIGLRQQNSNPLVWKTGTPMSEYHTLREMITTRGWQTRGKWHTAIIASCQHMRRYLTRVLIGIGDVKLDDAIHVNFWKTSDQTKSLGRTR